MENKIFDINEDFDYNILNLDNPTLLGKSNSYISKFTHGKARKNIYIQFPKCMTKQGIVKTATKTFCELCFSVQETSVIEFFENLEKYAIEKIYNNKDIWFYNSESINYEDIEDIFSPIIKSYKHGKQILIKTNIKNDKINIYDENEKKLTLDEFDKNYEIIPLINLDTIKFSNKNFYIELNLTQMLVLYPSDEFENKLLIQIKDKDINSNTKDLEKEYQASKNNLSQEKVLENKEEILENNEEVLEDEEEVLENKEETLQNKEEILENNEEVLENNEEVLENNEKVLENNEKDLKNKDELMEIENLDINQHDVLELKSQTEIYLEIYSQAKKKAKEIRKNAIQAFLEAKKIKLKYNLESLVNSDSSEDDENIEYS